jgi:hypothetical protein
MAQENEQITTISVKALTKQRLLDTGSMGESYDDLINRLLDVFKSSSSWNKLLQKEQKC